MATNDTTPRCAPLGQPRRIIRAPRPAPTPVVPTPVPAPREPAPV